ncbi:MAG: methylated-DNA--[protein]-cysteine S-methyltransferase [Solirubrobacterales bacterium]|nr:methylated-DNA--[protein]-cysteine S-methyltransferase [Solirubrobacterales bacterium]
MDAMTHDPANETLCFGYGETMLGLVLIALSGRGVAAILLGNEPASLRRELAAAYPGVRLIEDDDRLAGTVAKIVAFIESPGLGLDLPLDMRGSELELAVWEALRDIPPGETRTYGALAKALAVSATAQEVGAACAANKLAVAVPCHRVVKADGSISGYRWGVQRKRRLINMEGVG